MSLDKAIFYGKEHRKPFYDSRRFDRTCRNHGACGYCRNRRLFKNKRREQVSIEKLNEYLRGEGL